LRADTHSLEEALARVLFEYAVKFWEVRTSVPGEMSQRMAGAVFRDVIGADSLHHQGRGLNG
jgi:hypothetical protein